LDDLCDMNGIALPPAGSSSPTVGNHEWPLLRLIFNCFFVTPEHANKPLCIHHKFS
jgi:hypothetical protein